MTLTRYGIRELALATILCGAACALIAWGGLRFFGWMWVFLVPVLAAWLLVLAFFRDPKREIPDDPELLVAPADGRVTDVERVGYCHEIGGAAVRVSIFLSIFDVHVNRSPCKGRVMRTDYRRGAFLDARDPESELRNECNTIIIDPAEGFDGPIVIRQIAGAIARRIVCRIATGDNVERGQRIGMIKFGSRTDLIVPADSKLEPVVRINDHVKGGRTVLLRRRRPAEAASPAMTASAGTSVGA